MTDVSDQVREIAESNGFSGAVRLWRQGAVEIDVAYGMADRAHGVPATTATRFATASATKGFTALAVMRLVEMGALTLSTAVRALLDGDLALIDDRVTIEHLLGHRSGIGDYFDEDADPDKLDYAMSVPVHALDGSGGYLAALDGHGHGQYDERLHRRSQPRCGVFDGPAH